MYDYKLKIEKLMIVLTDPDEAKRRGYKHYKNIYYPTEKNKEVIISYQQTLTINAFKESTIHNKLSILRFFAEHYHKDFELMTKQDVKQLLFKIETEKTSRDKERTAASKAIKKQLVKDFLKFLFEEEIVKEKFFESIHVKIPNTTVTADDIYTEEEVNAMIGKAINSRDKAFIALLYDVGGRIGEILPMKLRSIEQLDKAIRITISGKTGTRSMLLESSIFYVRQWLNAHPDRNNPEAYLWCTLNECGTKEHVNYITMLKNVKDIAKKAGITKRIYNHAFRHSSVTRDAEHYSEALNKTKHGWSPSSNMLSNYSHLNSANLEKAQLEKMGLAPIKINRELNRCQNCDEINPYDFKWCGKCGYGLNAEVRKEKDSLITDILSQLQKNPEIFAEALTRMKA
ncbi:integrase family protein [Methanolobus psychrophilus R15]|nr:integrase family protein [Methanolobus psychrophilus R15]